MLNIVLIYLLKNAIFTFLRMSSVQKVLISYEEFMKLKDLEKRFESVSSELAALKQSEKGKMLNKFVTLGLFVYSFLLSSHHICWRV